MVPGFIVRPILLFFTLSFDCNNIFSTSRPTALDALAFAYLHCLLAGPDGVRVVVPRKVNLCAWERRVESIVQASYATALP